MQRPLRNAVGIAAALLAFVPSGRARAETAEAKQACVAASEEAQTLRDEHALTKAREKLVLCARDTCPRVVRKDCSEWLSEVDASLPTVVLAARAGGTDVSTATVSLDGHPLADHLDGKALLVDPGPHTFRFELAGKPPIEQRVVVKEGEHNRAITADFDGAGNVTDPGHTASPPDEPRAKPSFVPAYVAGGVALVAVGGFAFFGITGRSDVSNLRDTCGATHSCKQDDVDAAKKKLLVADISLGVAVVAAGVATYFFLSASSKGSAKAEASRALHLTAGPVSGGGGAAALGGAF